MISLCPVGTAETLGKVTGSLHGPTRTAKPACPLTSALRSTLYNSHPQLSPLSELTYTPTVFGHFWLHEMASLENASCRIFISRRGTCRTLHSVPPPPSTKQSSPVVILTSCMIEGCLQFRRVFNIYIYVRMRRKYCSPFHRHLSTPYQLLFLFTDMRKV